jgi:hypothetical protein
MSAKKSKKARDNPTPSAAAATSPAPASPAPSAEPVAWIDSDDPKKRQWAKIILVALWIYVAALALLAIDQWFHLGIFGPKVPPI